MRPYLSDTVKGAFILALVLILPAATASWAKGKSTLSPVAKAGKKVFDQNCTLCHFPNQSTTKIGPGLKGLFKHKQLPYSHRPTTVANVHEQIENGNPKGKPMPMPSFSGKLSKVEINNLIAYLKTL